MNKHAPPSPSTWSLQDAKAKFSEVVRRAAEEGPQHVTVHGKEKVVIVSAEEYARKASPDDRETGAGLIAVMRDPRIKGLRFGRVSVRSPVRDAPDFNDRISDVPARHQRRKRASKGVA